jgi:hypothetical protein
VAPSGSRSWCSTSKARSFSWASRKAVRTSAASCGWEREASASGNDVTPSAGSSAKIPNISGDQVTASGSERQTQLPTRATRCASSSSALAAPRRSLAFARRVLVRSSSPARRSSASCAAASFASAARRSVRSATTRQRTTAPSMSRPVTEVRAGTREPSWCRRSSSARAVDAGATARSRSKAARSSGGTRSLTRAPSSAPRSRPSRAASRRLAYSTVPVEETVAAPSPISSTITRYGRSALARVYSCSCSGGPIRTASTPPLRMAARAASRSSICRRSAVVASWPKPSSGWCVMTPRASQRGRSGR